MSSGGLRKLGWHWTTRQGWKRSPKRAATVKKAKKRRPFKKVPIKAADREQLPTFAEARKLAAEQGRAVSAPTPPTPEAAKPAPRQQRRPWLGKYADLHPPKDSQRNPPLP